MKYRVLDATAGAEELPTLIDVTDDLDQAMRLGLAFAEGASLIRTDACPYGWAEMEAGRRWTLRSASHWPGVMISGSED